MATKGSYEYTKSYKSRVAPRQSTSHRSSSMGIPSFGHSGGGGQRVTRTVEMSYGSASGLSSQGFSNVGNAGVNQVRTTRKREKKDMQDLNERLATYIETVKFHEAQNKKLAKELEDLRNKWGKETSAIKEMYEGEIAQLRKLLDEAEREKAEKDLKVRNHDDIVDELRRQLGDMQELVDQLKDRVDKQDQQLSDYEGEIAMLRRRRDNLEDERARNQRDIARLQQELNQAKMDLDSETLNRIDLENQLQTMKEEMEFMKDIYETQLKELAALAYRDTTAENREWWKSELGNCLREIQEEYESKIDMMRNDMEGFYKLKVQEYQTGAARNNVETTHTKEENNRLKTSITDMRGKIADLETRNAALERDYEELRRLLEERERDWDREKTEMETELREVRAHMESVLAELQIIMDAKLSLELEIAAYRKLLEGEETRVGLRQIVEQIIDSEQTETSQSMSRQSSSMRESGGGQLKANLVKGEMSAKTTYQRSAKGPVSITECNAEGKFIVLENTNKSRDENLSGWKITRKVDSHHSYEFVFPQGKTLRGGSSIRVVAQGAAVAAGKNDITWEGDNWGVGQNINTSLLNASGDERATHVQRTVYSS